MANQRMVLLELELKGFKGVRNFKLDTAGGADVDIHGENAAGKTTLFDAFTWLQFDKDSQNKKDFSIKTLDAAGKVEQHGVDHEVRAVLLVNGKRVELRKVFREKWSKKRGSAVAEFSGHETDHFIDSVPVKKGEFTAYVDGIMKEDLFKLLTSPTFFNEQLKWQDRRKTLLDVCGELSDEEVIAGSSELAELPAILGERSIEDHRKVIAAKRSEINKEIEKIPTRIDEVNRSLPDISTLSEEVLDQQIDSLKGRIAAKEAEQQRFESGGELVAKQKRVVEIEGEMLQIKNEVQAGALDELSAKRRALDDKRRKAQEVEFEIASLQRQIERNDTLIKEREAEAEKLRAEWRKVDAETFDGHSHATDCPTCGQALPEEQIAEAHEKALKSFNVSKSNRKERIFVDGKAAAEEASRLKAANADQLVMIEQMQAGLRAVREAVKSAEAELAATSPVPDITNHPAYKAKLEQKAAVESEIAGLRSSSQSALADVRIQLAKMRTEVEALERDKAKFGQVNAAKQRIADLKAEERQLAAAYEQLERELFLTEEFIRTKVAMLEQKINSKFRFARFKLFEQQINGGLTECCETLYNGVPYSDMNNAARINVGLDIINTLSEHYGFAAPIFIDNAEAVTELAETRGQQIRLIVSKGDKQLRVVTANIQEAI
ncbi:AAA family ATPase [Paenibacillus methanolicus]|uniref:Nuclease SbcCD subunit C n=1 Tax=Paenibacillus methanolicus TaxID=582686 RepID=A0A5S5BLW2_9BACL|nr:AAA family ATPase [Paenibacillus methanolicus]TYP67398.1 AAA domain-containing protein [Paenibacillus methanolicus]